MQNVSPLAYQPLQSDRRRAPSFSAALLHDKHSGAQTQTIRRHPLPNKHPDYTKRQARRACLLQLWYSGLRSGGEPAGAFRIITKRYLQSAHCYHSLLRFACISPTAPAPTLPCSSGTVPALSRLFGAEHYYYSINFCFVNTRFL